MPVQLVDEGQQEKQFIFRCPDPDLISKFLVNHCGFDFYIKPQDKICKSCYDFHLHILYEANSKQ